MLLMQAGYTTADRFALEWVKRGINSRYLDSIYCNTPLPATYDEWKTRVILLDDAWAQRLALQAHAPQARPQVQSRPPLPPRVPVVAENRAPAPAVVQTRNDGTGTVYGGRGQPMDLDRAGAARVCYSCGRRRGDAAPGCTNTWHVIYRAAGSPAAPAQPAAPQKARAMWEEDNFRENVRKWAAEDPESFKQAGFGFGSA